MKTDTAEVLKVECIYLNGSWHKNASIKISENGSYEITNAAHTKELSGTFITSICNFHSHAFQYAMAGAGENFQKGGGDDFWSWRESMYALALSVSPETLFAIARQLYSSMLLNGYDTVTEFHYLHHDLDGSRYNDPALLSKTLIDAAKSVGINIILCPIYYKTSNFGKESLPDQRRFTFKNPVEYLNLFSVLKERESIADGITILPGIHSLRAATVEEIKEIFNSTTEDFHIHIAEQTKEIEMCQKYYGKRPVELLFDNISNTSRLQLVHSTHINKDEISLIAKSGANVIICPTTEANLGDGIFPLNDYVSKGGHFTIGSDSHVCLSPFEELKILDFSQRLSTLKRSTSMADNEGEIGNFLFNKAIEVQRSKSYNRAENLVMLNMNHPVIATKSTSKILSGLISCFDSTMISKIYLSKEKKFYEECTDIRNQFLDQVKKI